MFVQKTVDHDTNPEFTLGNLQHTAVTDDGIRQLSRLPRLFILSLGGTRVTDHGIRLLKAKSPSMSIDTDR